MGSDLTLKSPRISFEFNDSFFTLTNPEPALENVSGRLADVKLEAKFNDASWEVSGVLLSWKSAQSSPSSVVV